MGLKAFDIYVLEQQHQEMQDNIRKGFSTKESLTNGAYNKLFKIGNDIVIRQVDSDKCVKNGREAKLATFNNIFVPSLLKECGEDTITTGYFNFNDEEMLYMEKAEGSLWEQFSKIYNINDNLDVGRIITTLNGKTMTDYDVQITLLTMILECFTTANFTDIYSRRFNMAQVNNCNQDVLTKFLSEDNMKVIARHLCKVFLFQMFDRKPENLLLKNGEDGKKKFIETDFDDIKEITCLFADIDQAANSGMNVWMWSGCLNAIYQMYNVFYSKCLLNTGKQPEWDNILSTTIQEYTITEEKMKNIIYDIAIKNKYFRLPENELIQGIQGKLELWKNMLNVAIKDETSQCFNQFKMAMQKTLAGLQEFNEDKIKGIVNEARKKQDEVLSLKNKYNTSADCNLRDYIPNWMKNCCGLCQSG